jgi:hypothetical protein
MEIEEETEENKVINSFLSFYNRNYVPKNELSGARAELISP